MPGFFHCHSPGLWHLGRADRAGTISAADRRRAPADCFRLDDKDSAIVNQNTARQLCQLLEIGRPALRRLNSPADLERWRDVVIQDCAQSLGRRDDLTPPQSPVPEDERVALAKGYKSWSDLLTARL